MLSSYQGYNPLAAIFDTRTTTYFTRFRADFQEEKAFPRKKIRGDTFSQEEYLGESGKMEGAAA
jgi:hypothetical protein